MALCLAVLGSCGDCERCSAVADRMSDGGVALCEVCVEERR